MKKQFNLSEQIDNWCRRRLIDRIDRLRLEEIIGEFIKLLKEECLSIIQERVYTLRGRQNQETRLMHKIDKLAGDDLK